MWAVFIDVRGGAGRSARLLCRPSVHNWFKRISASPFSSARHERKRRHEWRREKEAGVMAPAPNSRPPPPGSSQSSWVHLWETFRSNLDFLFVSLVSPLISPWLFPHPPPPLLHPPPTRGLHLRSIQPSPSSSSCPLPPTTPHPLHRCTPLAPLGSSVPSSLPHSCGEWGADDRRIGPWESAEPSWCY